MTMTGTAAGVANVAGAGAWLIRTPTAAAPTTSATASALHNQGFRLRTLVADNAARRRFIAGDRSDSELCGLDVLRLRTCAPAETRVAWARGSNASRAADLSSSRKMVAGPS